MSLCKAHKDNTPVYHGSKSSVLLTFIQLKECFSNAIFNRVMYIKRLSFSHSRVFHRFYQWLMYWSIHTQKRMHSSRMHIARSIRCSSRLPGRFLPRSWGVCLGRGLTWGGLAVCPRGEGRGLTRECLPETPPVNRMTDRSKNITLLQLRCGR